jgi:hypothetical protein
MKSLFESYAEMQEQLKGKQHKIDKNKNGQIDSHDFKLLRKEEETACKSCGKAKCECDDMKEATEPPFDGPYTTVKKNVTDKSGAVHSPMSRARDLARKALQNTKQKKYGTIQGHERFTSIPDKLKQSHFGKTNEEVLDEANHRDFASAGMMHPTMAKNMSVGDTMDYYEPKTGDKVHGKVMHKSDTEVHMKQTQDSYDDKKVGSVHKFKIGSQLPEVKEEVDLEEVLKVSDGAGKWISDFVHSENPKFSGKSKKERQQMALGAYYAAKKGVKEEVESIDEISKATLGSYAKKASFDSAISKKIAADFDNRAKTSRKQDMKDANTSIANDYKTKSWKRQDNVNKAIDRLTKEEVEQIEESVFDNKDHAQSIADKLKKKNSDGNYSVVADHGKHRIVHAYYSDSRVKKDISKLNEEQEIEESRGHKIVANFLKKRGAYDTPKKGDDLADKSYLKDKPGIKSDLKNLGRFLTGKKETNEETMKTFKEFAMMLEMEFKDGRYVHKGKYGTSYDDPEGKEDDESSKSKEPAVKRGRGRPAGAKSGARQLGGASKKGSGVEYTGYKLHLPNSNKSY